MKRTIEELERIAEQNESAMSTGSWWRERSEALDELDEMAEKGDRDIRRLVGARAELREMTQLYARGIQTGQGAIAVSQAQGTIIAITLRRPELTEEGDKELLALQERGE